MAAVNGYIDPRTCLIEIFTLGTFQASEVQDSAVTLNVLHPLNCCVTDYSASYNPSRGVEVGKKLKSVS